MKDYTKPYTTPYYDELKRKGIRFPCFLTHIRTDLCRMVKPKDARMFRMLFLAPRTDGCCGTIDTRPNTNLIMLNFPYILSKRRSEEGKQIRRQYKNDIGVPYYACKQYQLNQSGVCNCITTFTTDNNIIDMTNNKSNMEYHPNPTKEDLLEYFGQRIRIRKMTPREAFRLMDVDDADIDKIMSATETVTLKDGRTKTRKAISKTAMYKLAGNSIVVACLYHIFRTMFIPNQPESGNVRYRQLSIFE